MDFRLTPAEFFILTFSLIFNGPAHQTIAGKGFAPGTK